MQIEKNTKVRKVLLVVKMPDFAKSLKTVFEKNGDYIVDILRTVHCQHFKYSFPDIMIL